MIAKVTQKQAGPEYLLTNFQEYKGIGISIRKNRKRKILLKILLICALLCLLFPSVGEAGGGVNPSKKGRITGSISDLSTEQPMNMVSVTLYRSEDAGMVVGTMTDKGGNFTISMLDSGDYFVKISNPSFEEKQIQHILITESEEKVNLGKILLVPLPIRASKKTENNSTNTHPDKEKILFRK